MRKKKNQTNKAVVPFNYTGQVSLKLKSKGHTIELKGHNRGLDSIFRLFAVALAGYDVFELRPVKADLRGSNINSDSLSDYISCLSAPVPVSAGTYFYDSSLATWVTRLTISLAYSAQLQSNINAYSYFVIVLSSSTDDLAYLKIDKDKLSVVESGSEFIITWDMFVENATT